MTDCTHVRAILVRTPNGNYTRCKDCGEDHVWERKETNGQDIR